MNMGRVPIHDAVKRQKRVGYGWALPFLCEMIAESMWRAVGWVCEQRPHAVIDSLKQVFRWRSSRWWHAIHTEGMKDDPQNHTRWRHKWKWHNRGNVLDKIATDWTEFATLVLDGMRLLIAHRKRKGKVKGKQAGSRPPRKLGPADATVYTREDGPTVSTVDGWQMDERQEQVGTEVSGKMG